MPGPRTRGVLEGPVVRVTTAAPQGPALRPRDSAWRRLVETPSTYRPAPSSRSNERPAEIHAVTRKLVEGVFEGRVRENSGVREALGEFERELAKAHPELTASERKRESEKLLRMLERLERDPLVQRAAQLYLTGQAAPIEAAYAPLSPIDTALRQQLGAPLEIYPATQPATWIYSAPALNLVLPLKTDWVSVWIQVHELMIEAEAARAREDARQNEEAAERTHEERNAQIQRDDIRAGELRRSELGRQNRGRALLAQTIADGVRNRVYNLAVDLGTHSSPGYLRSIEEGRRVLALYRNPSQAA